MQAKVLKITTFPLCFFFLTPIERYVTPVLTPLCTAKLERKATRQCYLCVCLLKINNSFKYTGNDAGAILEDGQPTLQVEQHQLHKPSRARLSRVHTGRAGTQYAGTNLQARVIEATRPRSRRDSSRSPSTRRRRRRAPQLRASRTRPAKRRRPPLKWPVSVRQ
ncbi:hypothetical protein ANCCAN_02489 [Ancylostoma caninum]|uniref:Secreted protein n=1 Tax=Ancylostoma caninum TaxID=29170 RepID=A0A368H417_ANCCA|nr:hypothetical protein ANCCAN_02489 [Ancylostoma caninum]